MALLRTTILALALSMALPSAAARAALVEGVALSSRGPVAGATVHAFRDYRALAAGEEGIVSREGEKPGQFRLELAPGKYFFVATGTENGARLYSYHGLNPVSVQGDYRWLPFFLVESRPLACAPGPTGLGGVVTFKGRPLDKGVVTVFSATDGRFRGMGLLTNTLEADGRFGLDLEPGSYVVIARKRQGETDLGPLARGDLFCYPAANPLAVAAGERCDLEIPCYPRDDLQAFLDNDATDPRGRRETSRRAASLADIEVLDVPVPPAGRLPGPPAIVSGKVVDLAGAPRPGLFVAAYPAREQPLFQMHVIRMITRDMTLSGDDGSYSISLETGGTYYLVARERVGEAPDSNEYYGLYEGNANHSVTVAPHERKSGIDIVVAPIMPPLSE